MKSRDDATFETLTRGEESPAESARRAAEATPPKYAVLDRLWLRFATTPTRASIITWAGPILVVLLAAGTRLWNLASPHSLVFDETFYVKDAYTLSQLGYEAQWPENPNPAFEAGDVNTYLTGGSFVVHPQLGKWLISLGFLFFGGAENPLSWRISTAVIGILTVILLMVIAKGIFKSTLIATIAGLLIAIDGNAIVMSRVALLDNFVGFFALLGFGAVLMDRGQSHKRLMMWMTRRQKDGRGIDWGPALWFRPWLFAAGIAFGLTAAVKWNGFFFLAILAVYTVVVDGVARKHAGIPFWFSGTLLKQAPASFLLTVPIAIVTYLVTWTSWFVTKGGYNRSWAVPEANHWTGLLAWVPNSLQSFWHMQVDVWNYNINEHSGHPYAANPLTWLFMVRPTSMYFQGANLGENGCTVNYCGSAIAGIANPLIWYAATAAALYLVYRLIRFREWRVGLILAGLGAGYLPWLMYTNRTVYQFYTIAFEPYMILVIAYVIWMLLGTKGEPAEKRNRGGIWVAIYLLLAVAVSIFYWPMWTGIQIDWVYMSAHYWFPSWK
ncbi:dolichyl-phosphate-mannose--protein mannosyltransferase [Glaciihabitans sp. dw_435]|uniref:dolichyl-phosphate-mannose--protein mannosyltransferase n=1 Tax=Glaciihabitans sp. dw_435 TaxID=2720081 RepID=UPI001BD45B90|nr:phospholipid carrier-dependent glycosyltransferase [Glaciihabitans sp. dw_435]